MVELPEGKMKSREGTIVDADDLINELIDESKNLSLQLGKLKDASSDEFNDGVKKIALSALKYFILKVDPEKNMTFNPKESIDFDGNTGPFILYTYSRIQSLLKKAKELNIYYSEYSIAKVNEKEKELLKLLVDFTEVFKESYNEYNPSKIANYVYSIAKEYNQYYQIYPILKEEDPLYRNFRIKLSEQIGEMIAFNLQLLGIQTIDVM
jgi:arginyl-tRNA synthetase